MPRQILTDKAIPLATVRQLLEHREEEAPLNYVQRVTLEHSGRFSRPLVKADELVQKLVDKFGLSERTVIQILNLDPKKPLDIETVVGEKLSEKEKEEFLEIYVEAIAETERAKAAETEEKGDEDVF
jgi:DNA-directed RNA polymerase subunit F